MSAELETLIIPDVNPALLEIQRKYLMEIIMDDSILSCMTEGQQDALQGILHMLNVWSDARYYAANKAIDAIVEQDIKKNMPSIRKPMDEHAIGSSYIRGLLLTVTPPVKGE